MSALSVYFFPNSSNIWTNEAISNAVVLKLFYNVTVSTEDTVPDAGLLLRLTASGQFRQG